MSRVLGVLGGMGPAATLDFLGKLQALTPVERDEDHIRVIVDINPQIPDRNDPFARPGPVLAEMAGGLQGAGAQVLAIACDSAHVHADLISRASGLPLVDMIETASRAARDTGARRAGVLGARDAVRLYHEY
ncbi:aspartate/glutamate racemase family protein, partial [Phenylobacterium sp.]|uniref:aspartate/glutamate racemase family protein n=1 Tax=Phenylobacterium sp. TaxID=1871053 RepID=UPI002FDCB6BC